MNVFEDLIEELRDENLLEETIINIAGAGAKPVAAGGGTAVAFEAGDGEAGDPSASERDFYRTRAMDEIRSLQMVEHILSGIEREHMKISSEPYNDLQAKKALHTFLQVQGDSTTPEYADAEFHLMRETEAWSSAIAARDERVSTANLRRFCENSRPPLSSQALIALARFYRNSAFSELTRSKFDFVMTRLFSREIEGQQRRLLFGRAEMIGHIKTLYGNWASVALYSTDDIPLKARAIVSGFEDRVAEAESALTFDQLVQNDFFKKVHEFKEATGEIFFAPEVVAATICCNIKIGNKFVDLIKLERERSDIESIEQKYGYEHDQVISDAAGRTLHVADVLKTIPDPDDEDSASVSPATAKTATKRVVKQEKEPFITFELFAVNKWLLMATIIVVIISGGLYFRASQPSKELSETVTATNVNLDNSGLEEYVRSGRGTEETFYAITLPQWEQISDEKKREVMQKALEFANKNGKKNVQFVNERGRSVAFANKKRIELLNP